MMRRSIFPPVLALALGGLGAVLRMWHRAAGYDESGLPVAASPLAVALAVFLAACALLFLLLALRRAKPLADQSAAMPRGAVPAGLMAVSGVLLLVGGAMQLKGFAGGYLELSAALYGGESLRGEAMRGFLMSHALPLVVAVASVPTAIALLGRAKLMKAPPRDGDEEEEGKKGPNAFLILMPPLFCWLWLIEAYRQHTANPILWDYVLLLFAVVCLLVSGYYRAGYAVGVGKPRRTVWVSLLALSFSVAALPDAGDAATVFTLIALALHALAELTALLDALDRAPAAPQTEQKEDAPHEG